MGTRNRSLLTIAIAFIAGLLLGWIVLGWLLFPVQWSGALLQDLQPAAKQVLVETEAEAYALTQDGAKAVERLQALGSPEEVAQLAATAAQEAIDRGDLKAADRVTQMAASIGLALPEPAAAASPTPAPAPEAAEPARGSFLSTLLGLLLLGGGIALAGWLLLRRRPPQAEHSEQEADSVEPEAKSSAYSTSSAGQGGERPVSAVAAAGGAPQVVHEFSPTFHQGDQEYDQSFDIDAPDGAYLGECGMTMSEMVNGDPNRVTALEVWLFDKSDIRTVTKVLMTDYAYGNQALRDKLSSKGDALLLSPDTGFVLDAQTLRLIGKVVAMDYDDTGAPPRSALRRLSVQLKVIRQPGQ